MSAKRQEQLDECIEAIYNQFSNSPHSFYISYGGFAQTIQESLGFDDREVQDLWALFEDRYVQPRPTKNADLLNLSALERASEIGIDVPLSDGLQNEIVEYLYDKYLENPSRPAVPRDAIVDEFGHTAEAIDLNVYALKLKGWVDTTPGTGTDDAGYRDAELTDNARSELS